MRRGKYIFVIISKFDSSQAVVRLFLEIKYLHKYVHNTFMYSDILYIKTARLKQKSCSFGFRRTFTHFDRRFCKVKILF